MRSADSNPSDEHGQYFRLLKTVGEGLASLLGCLAEVVIHDFRRDDGTIIAIYGDVTSRSVGGSVSQIGLEIIAQGDKAKNFYEYTTTTKNGRVIRSSTTVLRDSRGSVFGAFCLNYDVTSFKLAQGAISELLGGSDENMPRSIMFSDELEDVVHSMVSEALIKFGATAQRLKKNERVQILEELREAGIFGLQKAVPLVAKELGVSRATIYNDLGSSPSAQIND